MTNEDECDECPETKNHTVKIFSPSIQVFSVEPFRVMAQISNTLYVVTEDSLCHNGTAVARGSTDEAAHPHLHMGEMPYGPQH